MIVKQKINLFYQALFWVVASLFSQCNYKTPNTTLTKHTQPTPITEEMIHFVKEEWKTAHDRKFLADMLRSLQNGSEVNINAKNPLTGGMTALHYAARTKPEIVEALLSRGARTDLRDHNNKLPLHYAATKKGNSKIVALLLDKTKPTDLEAKYIDRTPLNLAAYAGDVDMVKLLVKKGSDIETKDNTGLTPFTTAAGLGYLDIVHYLADKKGAKIDAADNDGHSPIFHAAINNRLAVVAYLVNKGAWVDIDQPYPPYGDTLRSEITNPKIIKLLTKKS